MNATKVLIQHGIQPDTYPADACIGDDLIGTYSADRQTVCIMIEDNLTQEEQQDINKCMITFEQVKEIAYTCKTLITNFGCQVHTYTLKNNKPFKGLTIVKPSNLPIIN